MAVYELNPFTKQLERVDAIVPPGDTTTGDTTLGFDNSYIPVDASASQIDITLPVGVPGLQYFISKRDASSNYVVINAPSGYTINGETSLCIRFQYSTAHIMADRDGNWSVI
jgi:hypothetical protein